MVEKVTFSDFQKLDIRVGEIIRAEEFPEARKPALKLWVNFENEIGIKKSSAQIKDNYKCTELIGRRVLAVVNFAPRQIGKFMSEILVLGVPDENKQVILIVPDEDVPVGGKVY
jgi:tRNA-binding protein